MTIPSADMSIFCDLIDTFGEHVERAYTSLARAPGIPSHLFRARERRP
jgi:hypothetical protein